MTAATGESRLDPTRREWVLVTLFIAGWTAASLFFLPTAFRIDEPNIIAIAKHAAGDPLHPYSFNINWLGYRAFAFDILANPPGIPWWLASVGSLFGWSESVLHVAMLPFAVLLLVAVAHLAGRFSVSPALSVLGVICSPGFFLCSQVVMPDIAMTSFVTASVAATYRFLDSGKRRYLVTASLFAAVAPLLKYNGIFVFIVLAAVAYSAGRDWRRVAPIAAAALSGLALWSAYTYLVYGRIHFLAMSEFERTYVGKSAGFVSIAAHLGLGVVPLFLFIGSIGRLARPARVGLAVVSIAAGTYAGWLLDYSVAATLLFAFSIGIAASLIGLIAAELTRDRWIRIFPLAVWSAAVVAIQFRLIFTSVRYLVPLLPAVVLILGQHLDMRRRVLGEIAAANILLVLAIAIGDAKTANLSRSFVREYLSNAGTRPGRLLFSGHWGFQYYAEQNGGTCVDGLDPRLTAGDTLAVARSPFPSVTRVTPWPATRIRRFHYEVNPHWIVRTVDCGAFANFYANKVGQCREGTIYLPFGISRGSSDQFDLYRAEQE
jgi:hypothetical protein